VTAAFLVSAPHKDAAVSRRNVEEKVARLLKAVRDAGVESTNLTLSEQPPAPDYRGSEAIGVISRTLVTLLITDMARVDDALAAAVRSGGTLNGVVFVQNTEHSAFENKARIAAATAARERAKGMAEALGARLGLPSVINDQTSNMEQLNVGSFSVAADGSVTSGFASKTITVTSRVSVQFDLEAP
jgi:uncharacterized protein YggE